jgi:hypothetical protein
MHWDLEQFWCFFCIWGCFCWGEVACAVWEGSQRQVEPSGRMVAGEGKGVVGGLSGQQVRTAHVMACHVCVCMIELIWMAGTVSACCVLCCFGV